MKNIRKISLLGSVIVLAILIVGIISFVGVLIYTFAIPRQYVTTDIADYGDYTGNYDNKSVQSFISSFFPEEIEENFSNVTYSYRAQKNDAYAFEAYLSFTIENAEEYATFVDRYTAGLTQSDFYYDNAYLEYVISDEFVPVSRESKSEDLSIRYARIGKILCCPQKQELIFVAIGVYDGGIAKTDFLSVYFDRFGIDPREYVGQKAEDGSVS